MSMQVQNINDLQAEIYRLRGVEKEQSVALRSRFSSPAAIFSTVISLFPKENNADGAKGLSLFHPDILNLISRFVIPLTLNKTIFRRSGFLVKTLVGLVSQKASNYVNEDTVSSFWGKAKALFNKFTHKKEEARYKPAPYIKPAGGAAV